MTEWQPIETAPKDGTLFLAYAKGFLWDAEGPDEDWVPERPRVVEWRLHAFRSAHTGNVYEFTHWMPLPDPPKD